tara:strand:- start:134042 stop:134773 length:732 start_codon:yes stop_codon:yes gene_type:complete
MDNFQIETAQNVNIVQNVAGIGDRIVAYIVDGLVIGAYVILIYVVIIGFFISDIDLSDSALLILFMAIGLPILLYHLLFEMFWNGQSPGKKIMKIRVVKLDGSKPAFSNYLLRWLLRVIDFGLASGAVALVTILINGRGQRLGDLAAATTVISEKTPIQFSQTILMDLPEDYEPMYPQVTVFSDSEIQTIKNVYTNAKYGGNHNVILRLSNKVATVMEVTFEETPMVFIDKVIKDYNYYTQNM